MIGLKRGTVALTAHREEWEENARWVIWELREVLGEAAVDIQHVGSTAIRTIHAKPIIDIVLGVRALDELLPYVEPLEERGFVYRGEDVRGQRLLVMGDFREDTRTHHIHVVEWGGTQWNNYIYFRDYLNACPERASLYDKRKRELAAQFPGDRTRYTAEKQEMIERLLDEAARWRAGQWAEDGLTGGRESRADSRARSGGGHSAKE